MDDIIIVIAALTIFVLILGLMHHDKENKKIDKEYEGSIKETPKLKIECEDFEEFLTEKESNFINEYKYLKTLLLKLKAAEIKNEQGLNNYIRDQFKALNAEEALYKQTIFKELEEIFATYLGDYENGASHTKINEKNYRLNISFSDAEQYHAFVQGTHGILGSLMMQKLSEESKTNKIKLNDPPHWFDGEIYEEGDFVKNLGTGKGVQLNNIEMSLWDMCSGFALTIKLTKSADTEEKIIDISQWFKQNNPEAHKILFLDNLLFENTLPIYLLYKIR